MRPKYYTFYDPELTHQVILFTPSGKTSIMVSCNCRRSKSPVNGVTNFDPIGVSRDLNESRELYNDPENHKEPFTEADKAKW